MIAIVAKVAATDDPGFYDSELRAHHAHLRAAYRIRPGDRVLDVGCGAGLTTREAARAATPGRALGIDISERMLEHARAAAQAERLDNVDWVLADAQTYRFPPGAFDAVISRFGTMFFADPAAAFANIAAALRPGGRLALLVWQAGAANEWAREIAGAVGEAAQPPPPGADPFSLGDPASTTSVLEHAGFEAVGFAEVHEPVFYGPDVEDVLETVRGFQTTRAALATLDAEAAGRAGQRLRRIIAAHHRPGDGVVFDARSWLITGRRSGR